MREGSTVGSELTAFFASLGRSECGEDRGTDVIRHARVAYG
jgi:hypothetical protein